MSEAPVLENVMKVTKQWDIPHYQDPWVSANTKVESYRERAKAGLTVPMARPVFAYDIETMLYSGYDSKTQCAEKLDIPIKTLHKGIKQGKGVVDRYFVAVSKTRLEQIIKINKFLQKRNDPIIVLCIDTFDGSRVVYKSQSKTAKQLGCSDRSVEWGLTKGNLINGRYKVEVVK